NPQQAAPSSDNAGGRLRTMRGVPTRRQPGPPAGTDPPTSRAGKARKPGSRLFLFLLDRLLDRLHEVGVLLVGRQLGGVGRGLLALGVLVGRPALVGVVKHAPDQPHPRHLGGAAARLGLGGLGGLGRFLLGGGDGGFFLLFVAGLGLLVLFALFFL